MKTCFSKWCLVAVAAVIFPHLAAGDEAALVNGLQEDVIPLDQNGPAVTKVRDSLAAELAGVKTEAAGKVTKAFTKAGGQVVGGDLFKTGTCFALFETSGGENEARSTMGLAEWAEGKWLLRGLWKLPVVWLEAGKKWDGKEDNIYYPVEPFHEPFELLDLSGDGVPEVIVAGEVDKYFNSSSLLKYDAKTRGLDLLEWTMGKPKLAGKRVLLYQNSGRRSIWEEWRFCEWKGDKLVERASWHSGTPYNNTDPSFWIISTTGSDGTEENFRVTLADSSQKNVTPYTVLKDDKPFAEVSIKWKAGQDLDTNRDLAEGAWFFEKLTGLTYEDFLEIRSGTKIEGNGKETPNEVIKPARMGGITTIRVKGSEEARNRLAVEN